jgi:hypothetical protein
MAKRGYTVVRVAEIGAGGSDLAIYTNQRVMRAFEQLEDLKLTEFARVVTLLEAAYKQGTKDGAASAFGLISDSLEESKKAIPHGKPGRPRTTPKKAKKPGRSKPRRRKK